MTRTTEESAKYVLYISRSNELIIQSDPMAWSSPEHRPSQAAEILSPRKGQLEGKILQACVRYLLLQEIDTRPLISDNHQNIADLNSELPFGAVDDTESVTLFDPMDIGFGGLFTYASCHWTSHYAAAPLEALPPLDEIEELCKPKSQRLENWLNQIARPDCNISPTFTAYLRDEHDILSITAQYGSEDALRRVL